MSENTKIEWTDHTFNPWIGCTEVSCGCARCYAKTLMDTRYHKVKWGKGQPRLRTTEANWKQPIKWAKPAWICDRCGTAIPFGAAECKHCPKASKHRPRVFCASLADWLDEEAPIEWLADLLKLIHDTPNLDWLLLTKRPENWSERLHAAMRTIDDEVDGWASQWLDGDAPANVWLGTTVENQEMADKRIPLLMEIPARVRFLSVEPMLGPINFTRIGGQQSGTPYHLRGNFWDTACENHCSFRGYEDDLIPDPEQSDSDAEENGTTWVCPKCHCESGLVNRDPQWPWIDWVIFGGESGPGARPCNIEWIRDGVRQCQAAGVAAFVKQLGADPLVMWPLAGNSGAAGLVRARKVGLLYPKAEAKPFTHPKGGDMAEWPEELRVRQFPEVAR